jgi:hypothetical protein
MESKNILERVQKVINLFLEQENSLNAIERHLQLLSNIKTEDDDKLTSYIETIRVHVQVLKTHTAYNHLVERENIKLYKEQVKERAIENRDRKQRHVESSLGEMLHFNIQTKPITKKKRCRGRPKGSKNKPKS